MTRPRIVVAGLLLMIVAITLQLHFLVWGIVLIVAIWQFSRTITSRWLNEISAIRKCGDCEGEVGARIRFRVDFSHSGRFPVIWALGEELLPRLSDGRQGNALKIKGTTAEVLQFRAGEEKVWEYEIEFLRRGYYQIGPLVVESGDLFGMDRRYRNLADPVWVLIRPGIKLLDGYDVQSRRPVGEIVMTHRLFEDPTRTAGIREYQMGDSMNRIHWRATARTGTLQSRVFEASCVAGATLLVDFHRDSFDPAHEPVRSELAITAAASISSLLYEMNQQFGLVSNGRDAAERIREEGWKGDPRTRHDSRSGIQMTGNSNRLRPVIVPTNKSPERLNVVLDQLARLELTDGMALSELVLACNGRIPRDATIISIVSIVDEAVAFSLENLRRGGFAVTAIVNCWSDNAFMVGSAHLASAGVTAFHLKDESMIQMICQRIAAGS